MTESVKQDKAGTLTLRVVGKRVVQFAGSNLPRVESVLTTAAGVVPRRGDVRADIRAWKFVCGWNARQMMLAAGLLRKRVDKILRDGCPTWQEDQEKIAAALLEVCPDASVPDGLPLADLAACDEWSEIAVAAGRDVAEKMEERFAMLQREDMGLAQACVERRAALEDAAAEMNKPVDVTVALVSWSKAPGALSGGYLRELAWMFDALPADLAQLAVQEGVDGRQ